MKKIILGLFLSLTLAGAAFAAPVEVKGFFGTEIGYLTDQDNPLGTTYLQLGLESKLQGNVTGVYGARFYSDESETLSDWYNGELSFGDVDYGYDNTYYAYAQSTGSLWEGAAPVKLTLGSVDVKYSPFVAWFGYDTRKYDNGSWLYENINGVALDDVKLGPIGARAFYVFDKKDPEADNTLGVNFKGDFDDIKLDATFVKLGEPVAYDLTASVSPVQDLDLSGQFIGNGDAPDGWYNLSVNYAGVPGWKLGASYRDFSPALFDDYAYRDQTPSVVDGSFVVPNPYDLNKGVNGLNLSASTSLAGFDLSGAYDSAVHSTQVIISQSNWSAKLKVFNPLIGGTAAPVDGKYQFQFSDEVKGRVVLRGNVTSDILALKNVELEGVAEFADQAVFGASAKYTAPIGLDFIAKYYTDDVKDDNGLGWIQSKGLALFAGYYLNF